MGRLEGKIALVTGGASGLGKGIAQRFAEEGAMVTITDIDAELGHATASEIGAGFEAHDVTDEDAWKEVIGRLLQSHGRLDVLVNNAGIFTSSPVDETPLEDFERVMKVNVTGTFLGCKHGVAAMKKNAGPKGGSIINMSSVTGLRGQLGGAAYSTSKGAVRILTKTVALENAAKAIRCNSIHPGIIDTPILAPVFEQAEDAAALRAHIESYLPVGYMGRAAQDIGNMAVYLAADESVYVTGAEMVVDGGMTIGLPS